MAKSYPQPVIFLGYVVTKPLAPQRKALLTSTAHSNGHLAAPYDILVTDGRMHDIDSDDWDRW